MAEQDASVNPHFLKQLSTMSEHEEIQATEDIFTANGVKLISKGTQISEGLYEKVISHKLKQPLECTIQVGKPVTQREVALLADELLSTTPAISRLAGWNHKELNPVKVLSRSRFTERVGSILRVHQSAAPNALRHSVLVALLGMGLAHRLKLSTDENFDLIAVSALVHDIGELYIEPELFAKRSRPMTAIEWRQLAAHPAIGHKVLKDVGGIAPAIADIVVEHHERGDGSGYPRGLAGEKLLQLGHVLAAAESLSAFCGQDDRPFARAEIAMKVMPGEFRPEVIDVLTQIRAEMDAQQGQATPTLMPDDEFLKIIKSVFDSLRKTEEVNQKLMAHLAKFSTKGQKIIGDFIQRLARVHYALCATGLDAAESAESLLASAGQDPAVRFDMELIMREIRWRLSNLAHNVSLQSVGCSEIEQQGFEALRKALSGE